MDERTRPVRPAAPTRRLVEAFDTGRADGSARRTTAIVAHRGGASDAVENSLEAFEQAIAVGADAIELDVRRTRDGRLIAFHDAKVAGARVGALTHAEIARLTGHLPPLLADVLELARGRIALDIELKEAGYVEQVLAAVPESGDLIVTSFIDRVLVTVERLRPDLRTGLLLGRRPAELHALARAARCGADYVAPRFTLARIGLLKRAAAAGFPAIVWTVNRDGAIRGLLDDDRVAAIITDLPARALELRDG